MIDDPDAVPEDVQAARLEFLRDEGMRVLAAYRQIPDRAIRQSIVVMIEKVAGSLSTKDSLIVFDAADNDKLL